MKEKHTFGFLGHLFAHFKCLMIFVLNKKTVGPFAQCIPLTDAIKQRFPGYPQGRGLKLRFSSGTSVRATCIFRTVKLKFNIFCSLASWNLHTCQDKMEKTTDFNFRLTLPWITNQMTKFDVLFPVLSGLNHIHLEAFSFVFPQKITPGQRPRIDNNNSGSLLKGNSRWQPLAGTFWRSGTVPKCEHSRVDSNFPSKPLSVLRHLTLFCIGKGYNES